MSENTQAFPQVFQELMQRLGLKDASLDSQGECVLHFGDTVDITIHYSEQDQQVVVFAPVADISEMKNRGDFLDRLNRANFFWTATKGFTLTLQKDSWLVVLMGREAVEYFSDLETLARHLGTCAEIVWEWQQMAAVAEDSELPKIYPGRKDSDVEQDEVASDANPYGADFLLHRFIIP